MSLIQSPQRLRAAALLVVTLLPLAPGCASPTPEPKVAEIEQQHLSFVRDGVTSREQALLQLGLPSGQFEGERIMTWRLCYNGETLFPIAAERAPDDPRYTLWRVPAYNLVLVFDARNLVQRYSFIEVR
jgi:hypothetical protein